MRTLGSRFLIQAAVLARNGNILRLRGNATAAFPNLPLLSATANLRGTRKAPGLGAMSGLPFLEDFAELDDVVVYDAGRPPSTDATVNR